MEWLCRCPAPEQQVPHTPAVSSQAAAAGSRDSPEEGSEEWQQSLVPGLGNVGLFVLCAALACAAPDRWQYLLAILLLGAALLGARALLRRGAGLDKTGQLVSRSSKRAVGEVVLHVYDFGHSRSVEMLNSFLLQLGIGGAFHTSVEVHGREWAYGFKEGGGSGVFYASPGSDADHGHRLSLTQGVTSLPEREVEALLQNLSKQWAASDFDSFCRNCVDFCEELCQGLQVQSVPRWVGRGPRIAASVFGMLGEDGEVAPEGEVADGSDRERLLQETAAAME